MEKIYCQWCGKEMKHNGNIFIENKEIIYFKCYCKWMKHRTREN